MYVPDHFALDEKATEQLLHQDGAADLITATRVGLFATFLPFIYDPETGHRGALLGHLARNNEQWRHEPITDALVIVRGTPDTYISPAWYASKVEHGRVVPTWNYVVAHVYGRLHVRDDAAWVDALVRRLTAKHEAGMPQPWTVDDAPVDYINGQLQAVVGVELEITHIEAKAKLSQNRSDADRAGVVAGLRVTNQPAAADAVRGVVPKRHHPQPPR